jgi:acetylcholinesterase
LPSTHEIWAEQVNPHLEYDVDRFWRASRPSQQDEPLSRGKRDRPKRARDPTAGDSRQAGKQGRRLRHKIKPERIRDSPVVQTSLGKVRGSTKTVLGKAVNLFLGIPYAKPPVGSLRFKKPLPADPWQDVYDASRLPNSCVQESYYYYPGNYPTINPFYLFKKNVFI